MWEDLVEDGSHKFVRRVAPGNACASFPLRSHAARANAIPAPGLNRTTMSPDHRAPVSNHDPERLVRCWQKHVVGWEG